MNRLKKTRMLGVDTIHEIKIDKDTIITRNLKLEKRTPGKKPNRVKKDEREPDWSYSQFPKEVSPYVEQFKRNMTECLKEVQSKDKRTVKRLSPLKESPVHGECLIACVLKRNGVIENAKINKGNLILLVSKFYAKDTKLMKKLEKNLDRCIETSVRNKDECALASQLNDCTNDLMTSNKHKIVVNY
uniref:Odorant Binding Protein 38 n=1 Tax=Dendrolimus punctatus TaxID=238572 RepID=A0A2K8GKN8_9NEOP|nr:Odorant Binding Protein 38 [Dendrolimus punctatus]